MDGAFGSLSAPLVLVTCVSPLFLLEGSHWVAESWQWAILFLMLKLAFNGDIPNQWKPYMGTLAASTYTVFLDKEMGSFLCLKLLTCRQR